jgi:hypothetical protein
MKASEVIARVQNAATDVGGLDELIEIASTLRGTPVCAPSTVAKSKPVRRAVAKRVKLPGTRKPAKPVEAAPAPPSAPKAKADGKRERASKAEVEALKSKVYEQAKKLGTSFTAAEVANHIGAERADVSRMLGKLEDEGKISHTGTRRDTRYLVAA